MNNSILMGILLKITNSTRTNAKDLADDFEISTRSVYRYIDALCESGVPIISIRGKFGGFEICNNYVIEKKYFQKSELDFLIYVLNNEKNSPLKNAVMQKLNNIRINQN